MTALAFAMGLCVGFVAGMGVMLKSTWIPGAPGRNAKQGTQDVREPL